MSFLRLASPGQPTKVIDEGPAVGRTHHTRGSLGVYGALVVAESASARHAREQREHKRRQRSAGVPGSVCGRPLPLAGTFCGRHPGHAPSCRSRQVMDANAHAKRLRLAGGGPIGRPRRVV